MKQKKITKTSRLLLVLCAAAMVVVLFVPLWKIDLVAPQYPEGLSLLISPDGLSGNVDIINGLNHYIGMKTLHTEDFIEFRILPYIIGFFALLFLITFLAGSRKLLTISALLFICFGILAMYDFWKWEYDYGHDLDLNAAIQVPGMAYQPPLIGYKQLLNFSAYSFPATGGWLFLGSGVLVLFSVIAEWRLVKKEKQKLKSPAVSPALLLLLVFASACSTGPEPIIAGKDACDYCKMTVSDQRFGAEAVTKKGKVYKFDDTECLLSFVDAKSFDRADLKTIYIADFCGNHSLIEAGKAFLLESEKLRSPMGGNIAAFKNMDSLKAMTTVFGGETVTWDSLYRNE